MRIAVLVVASAAASVIFALLVLAFDALPGSPSVDTMEESFWNLATFAFLGSGPVTLLLLVLARNDPHPQWDTAFALSALSSATLLIVGYWFVWGQWGDLLTGTLWVLVLGAVGTSAHAAALRLSSSWIPPTPPPDS